MSKQIDSFLQKKWEHFFKIFIDSNKNNVLEWKDFEIMIERIKTMRGDNSDIHSKAKSSLHSIWETLVKLSDQNCDRKISLDEWNDMWKIAHLKHTQPDWQLEYLDFMFMLLDNSNDHLIDKGEYVEVMESYGLSKDEAVKAFDKFAVNGRGEAMPAVDLGTFKKLWHEYFESTDTKAPGNYLFGLLI